MLLYIPIWFYSNTSTAGTAIGAVVFTFQSGSIQMPLTTAFVLQCLFFTFQSGSIQIIKVLSMYWCSGSFTFQSGSIQMLLFVYYYMFWFTLHSNLVLFKCGTGCPYCIGCTGFTFQSGSIQIKTAEGNFFWTYLYIPIWFYSNIICFLILSLNLSLYIPIWFYSNGINNTINSTNITFTFQSGSIQIT